MHVRAHQPTGSWIRSRSAGLWRRMTPAAARVARGAYGPEAGAEALLRAFLAERDRDSEAVRFWIAVYASLVRSAVPPGAAPPP